eukprot:jgi/Tetstr1/422619/TSEL_013425.t1
MNAPPQDTIVLVLNDYSNPGIDITTENERRDANLTIFRSIQETRMHITATATDLNVCNLSRRPAWLLGAIPGSNIDLCFVDVSLGAYGGGALEAYTKSTHTEAERTEFQKAVMSQLTGWTTEESTRHTKKQSDDERMTDEAPDSGAELDDLVEEEDYMNADGEGL